MNLRIPPDVDNLNLLPGIPPRTKEDTGICGKELPRVLCTRDH